MPRRAKVPVPREQTQLQAYVLDFEDLEKQTSDIEEQELGYTQLLESLARHRRVLEVRKANLREQINSLLFGRLAS